MITHKWYRWLKSWMGWSSFSKTNENGETTYIIVKGDRKLVESLQRRYTQEY